MGESYRVEASGSLLQCYVVPQIYSLRKWSLRHDTTRAQPEYSANQTHFHPVVLDKGYEAMGNS